MVEAKITSACLILAVLSVLFSVSSATWGLFFYGTYYHCLSYNSPYPTNVHNMFFASYSPSYSYILQSSIQNLRFNLSTTPKPRYIITPYNAGQVRAAILCSKKHGLQVRVRSGGHDYAGLSYKAEAPFVLIDLVNLRNVRVDLPAETVWVQAGATIGQLYYQIGNKTQTFGFPAGTCPTIGVGGHFSGGGQGTLMRKFGLSSDNIVDAILVNADGIILDRKSMGEDLFWAIRGGGGSSFGIIVEWKIKLAPIPPNVTVFTISKTINQGATGLVQKWQQIAPELPKELFIRIILKVDKESDGRKKVKAIFESLYLGSVGQVVSLMKDKLPELGLKPEHCKQMSWIESVLHFENGLKDKPINVLMDRNHVSKGFFVAKSDFVDQPIGQRGLKSIWKVLIQEGEAAAGGGVMIWEPYGGKMSEISESETPFPYRKGILYNIQYFSKWQEAGPEAEKKRVDWINKIYNAMEPYVSKNPRSAYLNYRDLSLGINKFGNGNYSDARVWGERYFKHNFERLARVKRQVDPFNFFKNEQSIPLP